MTGIIWQSLRSLSRTMIVAMIAATPLLGQGQHGVGSINSWPEDLEQTTVTGLVVVDSSLYHWAYLLDEDQDGEPDIHLAFGPWWYQPPSGASRPSAGELVTATGSVHDSGSGPTLIVFELNGVSWREAMEYGMHGWNGMSFWQASADTLTVTGTVLIDTTYFYEHFYLDSDNDSLPDYQLVFGPNWYRPTSGTIRPGIGDTVTVSGTVQEGHVVDMLVVYMLDGLLWRREEGPADWSGTWMRRQHADTLFAYCVNDSSSWVAFPPNHMMMGGMRWPDSVFVQFWRVPNDSLPGRRSQGYERGFYIDIHDPEGHSMMDRGYGRHAGMMSFSANHRIRLHYDGGTVDSMAGPEDGIHILASNEDAREWETLNGTDVNPVAHAVSTTSRDLSRYFAVSASESVVSVERTELSEVPTRPTLYQNYPNPFNPVTTITYETTARSHIVLSVHDLLGRTVATLVDGMTSAGRYDVSVDGSSLPSGVYIYRLSDGVTTVSGRMLLAK